MKTFKTQVYLNEYAKDYCRRAFGVRRVVWNWTLDQFLSSKRATGKLPNTYPLDTLYRKLLKDEQRNDCFEWLLKQQTSPALMMQVLADVKQAFALARTQGRKLHKKIVPQFKKKSDRLQTFSYYHSNDNYFRADSEHVFSIGCKRGTPRCTFRTAESIIWMKREDVKLCSMTISCRNGKYWLTVAYEKPNRVMAKPAENTKIGIDLGIVKSVVSYDGTECRTVSFNTKRSMHLDRLSKSHDEQLSKMKVGSHRYEKLLLLKEKRAAKAAAARNALLEEYTTFLVRNYHEIVIDDFSFKGALKVANPNHAYRAMTYAFKDKLSQKAQLYGTKIRFVNHKAGIKSTKVCCKCGCTSMTIDKHRVIHCTCGSIIDRDENAAMNCYKL